MSETNGTAAEVIEPEIETPPEAGGLIVSSEQGLQDIQFLADNIEKMVAAATRIRLVLMKLAQPGDWVLFRNKKKESDPGKAELGFAGANRIGSTLGVSFANWTAEKVTGRDDIGEFYRWEYQCDASHGKRQIRVFGRAGSRDVFFGKEDGKFKELHNVNEGNIKQAAMRAAKKEGVKDLFGLHHMDPKFLEANGIKLEDAGGYTFKNADEKAGEQQTATILIEKTTFKTNKPGEKEWTKFSIHGTEGDMFSTFDKKIAEEAKALIGTKRTATINYTVSKYGNDIVSFVANAAF